MYRLVVAIMKKIERLIETSLQPYIFITD